MEIEEYHQRLVDEFFRLIEQRGRGTMAELQRSLKLSPSYFSQWKQGKPVKNARLLQALEFLDVEPFVFFARALRPNDFAEFELDVLVQGRPGSKKFAPRTSEGKRAIEILKRKGLR